MANRIALLAGSPGAGKTSLLNTLAGNKRYKIVNIGDLMADRGIELGHIKDRDEIRFLSNKGITELRTYAYKKVSKMNGNIILDTHASVEANGRYVPGLPMNILDIVKLSGLMYVDAATEEIVMRREADKSRKREGEESILIDIQRLINMGTLLSFSSYLNIPLYVIVNRQNKLNDSIKQLKMHLKDIFGDEL